jgi:hypothetical protein
MLSGVAFSFSLDIDIVFLDRRCDGHRTFSSRGVFRFPENVVEIPTSFLFSGISNRNIVTHAILNIFRDADVRALHRVCDVPAEGDLLQALVFRYQAPDVTVVSIYIFSHTNLAYLNDCIMQLLGDPFDKTVEQIILLKQSGDMEKQIYRGTSWTWKPVSGGYG